MLRDDLKGLARMRLREAKVLINAKQYSGAYHLAGIAVECAIKACIAKKIRKHEFPDKITANKAWEHDPAALIRAAKLEHELRAEEMGNAAFAANWAIVKDWKVESRYDTFNYSRATALYSAIAARRHGVLAWLRRHW